MISEFCCIYLLLCSGLLPPRRGSSLCRQNPCLNGGICATAAHLNSFDCVCPDGFTGALCEKMAIMSDQKFAF
uniref:EGF-like domain-containing protein n=1 Tax=Sinocyclocheilus rhinocerous TaxID=307959 RepID=A0A673IF81_9TELE